MLKPGGIFYAEDFYKIGVFTPQEIQSLQLEVSCPYVPDLNTYKNQLRKAGFEVVEVSETPQFQVSSELTGLLGSCAGPLPAPP